MEAMLGLYIVILISTSKNALSFLLLLMCSLQQNWKRCGGRGRGLEKRGEMVQTMYAHMDK
jgi:hypothetical protein